MAPINFVNLAAVLVALLPAFAIAWALAAWLRRRTGSAMTWHCDQCPSYVTGLPRHEVPTWARNHATHCPGRPTAAHR
jgi:hypothetical protein